MSASTIWKFDLPIYGGPIAMPRDAKVLHTGVQNEQPRVWAEVDPAAEMVQRYVVPIGTGQHLPLTPRTFLGSTLLAGGQLVLHWYELHHMDAAS